MMILTAVNITGDGKLEREDGTADYDVWIGINKHMIWTGLVKNHVRYNGAGALLRLVADQMEGKRHV